MKKLSDFLIRCRQQLRNEEQLLWVSLQSNLLADLSTVENDFENAVEEMRGEMKRKGWILPVLDVNMRNQVNIAKVQVQKSTYASYEMQSSIDKHKFGTSLIGEIPILFKIVSNKWHKKKDIVLKHCIELMSEKNEKNIVVLWNDDSYFKDVADDIKSVIKDKKVVPYPSKCEYVNVKSFRSFMGISNVKQFVEKKDHILVTKDDYFKGCECANVIVLTYGRAGLRNSVLRGVQNLLCVQLTDYLYEPKMNGMKEDHRYGL